MNQNNVTPITDKQTAPAAKFIITATLDGFPVAVEVEGKADALRGMIDKLKAIGAQPPSSPMANLPQGSADDAPTCEFHGRMKRSNHGGWFCPKKMGDGSYCKSKG
jgi:hypothetical protein